MQGPFSIQCCLFHLFLHLSSLVYIRMGFCFAIFKAVAVILLIFFVE
jgi:hypothetical protein